MRYFTSDLHFGHHPIISYCQRPFQSVPDMDYSLVRNINSIVKPGDELYILGDFSFYPKDRNVEIVKSINVPVILIRGNHDHSGRIKRVPFADVYDQLDLLLGPHLVTMSHFPYAYLPSDHRYKEGGFDKYKDSRPKDVGLWLLHGHTHSRERLDASCRSIHVGCDAWNYFPVSEIDIERMINNGQVV